MEGLCAEEKEEEEDEEEGEEEEEGRGKFREMYGPQSREEHGYKMVRSNWNH